MNVNMWGHPAVARNLESVRELGYEVFEPDSGYLACGWTGPGRLADPAAILARAEAILAPDG
jgi:phosphopantothenoylcysteine decarboxylase/phosphopantothenate--cysteine ligase